jgi:Family of unknown function (DUF5990)
MPKQEVALELCCLTVPDTLNQGQPTQFGVQDKQEQLLAGRPFGEGGVAFRITVRLELPSETAVPDFTGPCVHGKKGERFLYLGYRAEGAKAWIRRWKIMLADIPQNLLVGATNQAGMLLTASFIPDHTVRLRPQPDGWQIQLQPNLTSL